MIRAIIQDISQIVEKLRNKHDFDKLAPFLDADVKFYLHNAFLDNQLDDFVVYISQGQKLIHLKVQIREDQTESWEHLGWSIEPLGATNKDKKDAYNRAMRGV